MSREMANPKTENATPNPTGGQAAERTRREEVLARLEAVMDRTAGRGSASSTELLAEVRVERMRALTGRSDF